MWLFARIRGAFLQEVPHCVLLLGGLLRPRHGRQCRTGHMEHPQNKGASQALTVCLGASISINVYNNSHFMIRHPVHRPQSEQCGQASQLIHAGKRDVSPDWLQQNDWHHRLRLVHSWVCAQGYRILGPGNAGRGIAHCRSYPHWGRIWCGSRAFVQNVSTAQSIHYADNHAYDCITSMSGTSASVRASTLLW